MTHVRALLVLALCSTACADSPGPANAPEAVADPLEGAWNRVEETRPEEGVVPAQPGMRTFVDGHYSMVILNGAEARTPLPDSDATDAQLVAAWRPLSASAGSYEVVADTVIQRRVVSKNTGSMGPGVFVKSTYRIAGDTLWISNVANQNGPTQSALGKYVRMR